MTVSKSVFECLIVGIVDAVEVVGAAAVAPFVAFQLSLIAVVGFVPDGCCVAAALYSEFHRRRVCGCAVFIEHNIQQVGLRQLRLFDGFGCLIEVLCVFGCQRIIIDAGKHDATVDAVLYAGVVAVDGACVAADAEGVGAVACMDEVTAGQINFVVKDAVDIDVSLFGFFIPYADDMIVCSGLRNDIAGCPLP